MKKLIVTLAIAGLLCSRQTLAGTVEADPNKTYPLTPEAGPWLICAACYVGPDAPELAHDMALVIRRECHLPAYVMNYGDEERKRQQEHIREMREKFPEYRGPIPGTRVTEQCAVLVGGYKDCDAATAALKSFRLLEPRCPSSRLLPKLFLVPRPDATDQERELASKAKDGIPVKPFVRSFVTRNALVAQDHTRDKLTDPALKKFNAYEEYSLLKCKKRYTALVAAYQGLSTIQADSAPTSVWEKLFGKNQGSMLEASAKNAHNIAPILQRLNLGDVYVLHTRQGSLVTIGGFDSPDDPEVQRIQRTLDLNQDLKVKQLVLPQVVVIEVPRP
jgi:hypothetical protein